MTEENYIVVLGWFRTKLHLRGNELLTFAVIYGFSQTEGNYFRGGIRYLERWLDVSRATVFNVLKSLMGKGLISPRTRISNGVRFVDYSVPSEIVASRGERVPAPVLASVEEIPENGAESARTVKNTPAAEKPGKTAVLSQETGKTETADNAEIGFEEFWAAFPRSLRKTQKKECRAFWKANKLAKISESVMRILEHWKNSKNWQDPQFIPAPIVWLRKKPWEAEDFAESESAKIDAKAHETENKTKEAGARRELLELRKLIKDNRETAYLASVYKSAEESAAIGNKVKAAEQGAIKRISNIIGSFPQLAELAKDF